MNKLEQLIELAGKATPGTWEVFADGGLPLKVIAPAVTDWHGDVCIVSVRPEIYGDGAWDADFIAAARNSTPSLTAMLAEHTKMREWIEKQTHPWSCMYKTDDDDLGPGHPCTCGLSELRAAISGVKHET